MKIKFEKEKAKECLKKILPSREAIAMGLLFGGYATLCYCKGHYDGRNYFGKSWDDLSVEMNKELPAGVTYEVYIREEDGLKNPLFYFISKEDDKARNQETNAEDQR